jgi:hypothetical protein
MNQRQQITRKARIPPSLCVLLSCALLLIVAGSVVVPLRRGGKPQAERPDTAVPLGVEQAVVVRSSGPPLVARPYRRGASVNVRIANQAQIDKVRVYDIRYVVNLPGEFDLMDYLTSSDGRPVDDLPSFPVQGLTSLTEDLETRIQEIERVDIRIWHGYYETLVGVGIFWMAWLLGLVFVGRPRRRPKPISRPRLPSLDERIDGYLNALQQGELSTQGQARLEALLLERWRRQLALSQQRMAASCRDIEQSHELGQIYRHLQMWLHDPRADIHPVQFIESYRRNLGERSLLVEGPASR